MKRAAANSFSLPCRYRSKLYDGSHHSLFRDPERRHGDYGESVNPSAPKAQADLIDFMAKIAKAGVQIIIESHSDHLFNGIRRLISQEKLALSDVAVYNFRQDGNGLTHAEPVEFTPQGGIQSYIPGMFEQFDIDLDAILKL